MAVLDLEGQITKLTRQVNDVVRHPFPCHPQPQSGVPSFDLNGAPKSGVTGTCGNSASVVGGTSTSVGRVTCSGSSGPTISGGCNITADSDGVSSDSGGE